MKRRDFLALGAAGLVCSMAGRSASAALAAGSDHCTLWLRRPESGQSIRATYWANGGIVQDEFLSLCYILRDVEEDQTVVMDRTLLDLLFVMQQFALSQTGQVRPVDILSGFRTPEHNKRLEWAADNSEHKYGRAADIRLVGVAPSMVAGYARGLQLGGVGQYDTFTHIDINRVRSWHVQRRKPRT